MRRASFSPFILSPVASAVFSLASLASLATLGLLPGAAVHAQTPARASGIEQTPEPLHAADPDASAEAGPTLKSTPMLAEKPPQGPGNEVPTFIFGDKITGRPNLETILDGHAELRRGPTALRADWLEYYQPDDTVKTRGNVRVSNSGNQFRGPELQLRLDTFEGFFSQPTYRFLNGGNGRAERIDFIDDKRLVARQATYTTCERGDEASWTPAWELRADSFRFDFEEEMGEASGASLRFKNVPFLYWPGTLSFPLSDKRKSGVLPPTFGFDTTSGFAVTAPYYFDIAPNRDATFSPTYLSKRGVDLGGEFRYLERSYQGELRANLLPSDKLRERNRWTYGYLHSGVYNTGLAAVGSVGLSLNLNRVSDDDYWRDFPNGSSSLTQRLLPSDASLSWNRGNFSSALRTLKWQTLQDVNSPIVPPYDRLPQLTARYSRVNAPLAGVGGLDWSLEGDYTRFSALRKLTGQPNANRTVTQAQLSRPWLWPAGFFTPKLQLHATHYQFDAALANGARSASRILPTFSLDTGLQFERDARYFGRSFTQTLEPRAFYVRTPYRDQSFLPNYDSGANSFNFASVFTENAFVGNDRISDAKLLTLGLTSRLLDPASGAEALRLGIAQRLRFEDQKVTLVPGSAPVSDRLSDVLLGASVNWTPAWSLDATTQYNPKLSQSERTTLGARYSPSNYRVISAAYRRQRGLSQQLDVGWQWPINDLWGDKGQDLGAGRGQGGGRWYSVGRLNYSVPDKKLVDALIGFEYDGCCWIGRVLLQRSQSSVATANTKIMFQLEFVGFSRIGTNPLGTLKSNIPRYQYLREQITTPSRFTNYD